MRLITYFIFFFFLKIPDILISFGYVVRDGQLTKFHKSC